MIKLIFLILVVLGLVYSVFAYIMGLDIDDIQAGYIFSKPSVESSSETSNKEA